MVQGQQILAGSRNQTHSPERSVVHPIAAREHRSGTFTVSYSDGTTSTATVTFADWIDTSAAAGTDVLATARGWNPGGTIPVSLFYAAIPLAAGRQVVSVTLPTVGPDGFGIDDGDETASLRPKGSSGEQDHPQQS
jgi:hypothetical protein